MSNNGKDFRSDLSKSYFTVIGTETAKITAEIFTDNPALILRLDELSRSGGGVKVLSRDESGVRYAVPKAWISINPKT